MVQQPPHFDGHLDLTHVDFSGIRVTIFHGASGSGKSTYIDNLVSSHTALRDRARTRITGGPIDWSRTEPEPEQLVIVDELLTLGDLWQVARQLQAGRSVIAASHLPARLTAGLGAFWPLQQFATDRDPAKIERFLSRRGIRFSRPVVADYCERYGATFTDAEIILEHTGGDDFDRAYARFESRCSIDLVRPRRAWF